MQSLSRTIDLASAHAKVLETSALSIAEKALLQVEMSDAEQETIRAAAASARRTAEHLEQALSVSEQQLFPYSVEQADADPSRVLFSAGL